jgi:hypothetical protein
MVESLRRHQSVAMVAGDVMGDQPEEQDSSDGMETLKRVNHWIRVVLGVVAVVVFVVGMIAFVLKYR